MTSWVLTDFHLPRRSQLWIEFLGLFVAAPVLMAVFLPPVWMFPVLFGVTALGLLLLHRTQGFHWADLLSGARQLDWRLTGIFTAIVVATCFTVMLTKSPDELFLLLRFRPDLLAMILMLYPVLSALPQELVYRPLFFRRYGTILPSAHAAIILNATLFSLAHLMYWSWVVAFMTFFGGLAFAWSYEKQRNFPQAVLLHAIAGNLLFTIGLGVFFYSGNVQRPF